MEASIPLLQPVQDGPGIVLQASSEQHHLCTASSVSACTSAAILLPLHSNAAVMQTTGLHMVAVGDITPARTCKLIEARQEGVESRALNDKYASRIELLATSHHIGHHAWRQPGCSARGEAANEGAVQVQHHSHAPFVRSSLHTIDGLGLYRARFMQGVSTTLASADLQHQSLTLNLLHAA